MSPQVPSDIDVVVAPPFLFIDWVRANISDQYQVAAQNCWVKSDGAFTGEISAEMLKDAQVCVGGGGGWRGGGLHTAARWVCANISGAPQGLPLVKPFRPHFITVSLFHCPLCLSHFQVPWVITGHSERRSLLGESNTFVGQKTGHALDVGLKVR